ncbi:MAG TPA: class I SAM-dependent methyltransferase [Sandaracinaceae bacterium]
MLDPELYDLVHTGTPGDVEHYVRLVGARRVLELGCGSGRVLVAMARAGARATGLEHDPGMIAGARARVARAPREIAERITLVEADMARFSLGRHFDRIVAPFASLYCLLSRERVAACFERVRAHLVPGGLFAFDGYAADEFHERSRPSDYPDDVLEEVAKVTHRGEVLTVFEKSRWDRARQRVDATYLYVGRDGRVRHEAVIGHRYLRRREIEPLLERAGLELVSVAGGFAGEPYEGRRGSLVVIARRPR